MSDYKADIASGKLTFEQIRDKIKTGMVGDALSDRDLLAMADDYALVHHREYLRGLVLLGALTGSLNAPTLEEVMVSIQMGQHCESKYLDVSSDLFKPDYYGKDGSL